MASFKGFTNFKDLHFVMYDNDALIYQYKGINYVLRPIPGFKSDDLGYLDPRDKSIVELDGHPVYRPSAHMVRYAEQACSDWAEYNSHDLRQDLREQPMIIFASDCSCDECFDLGFTAMRGGDPNVSIVMAYDNYNESALIVISEDGVPVLSQLITEECTLYQLPMGNWGDWSRIRYGQSAIIQSNYDSVIIDTLGANGELMRTAITIYNWRTGVTVGNVDAYAASGITLKIYDLTVAVYAYRSPIGPVVDWGEMFYEQKIITNDNRYIHNHICELNGSNNSGVLGKRRLE
uniref:Uncharacterized protein n=1 Tax=viral metagenome TaxID=1070528 RepID=A0A2V0RAE9_9ZZZZ